MNKSIPHYISELLFLHDCVIIPGFGGFVGNKKSAQLNRITGTLSPPSKQILFNKNLKTNDGLLTSYIASQEGFNQKIAQKKIELFVSKSQTQLANSKVLRIEKIGLFTVGDEQNITFLQDSSTNYNLDAFSMQSNYKKLVVEKSNRREISQLKTIKNKVRNSKILFKAAAVIIPLVALSYLSISQQERINNIYTQMATLNPFVSTEIAKEVIEDANKIKILQKPSVPVMKETISLENITIKNYYIIAGAFAEEKNANKMFTKLNRWNYKPEILKESNLLRVSYNSFRNREDAILALNKIKQENPEAWLLTK